MLVYYVKEPEAHRKVAPIDWAGALLLTVGLSALLLLALDGGRHSWTYTACMGSGAVVALVLFVIREHVAADPILPLDLMTRPVIAAALIGSLCFGAILFGLDTYVPLYIQGVQGGNATEAGRALMPLFLVWAISVALAARAVVRFGFRRAGFIGSAVAALGNLCLVIGALHPSWSRFSFPIGLAIVGTGMGPTSLSFILAVQHAVSWGQRGVATGSLTLLRTIGGATGVALMGAVLARELAHRLAQAGAGAINIASALRPETHRLLRPEELAVVQASLGVTLCDVYLQLTLLAVGSMICALWLPNKEATLSHSQAHERRSERNRADCRNRVGGVIFSAGPVRSEAKVRVIASHTLVPAHSWDSDDLAMTRALLGSTRRHSDSDDASVRGRCRGARHGRLRRHDLAGGRSGRFIGQRHSTRDRRRVGSRAGARVAFDVGRGLMVPLVTKMTAREENKRKA